MKNKVDLFIDSGAFSAWSQGASIDIQKYIEFIKEYEDVINVYSNLDVIGNSAATWKNQRIMERAGLHPIPAFHYGTDYKWLERYLKKGYDYISLGGMVPISTPGLIPWLDTLFAEYLTDGDGMPIVKVHGFGLTSLRLMLRYPWYSVDSTSWVATGRVGGVYVPRWRDGGWQYGVDSWKITVSDRSDFKKKAGKHFFTLSPLEQEEILRYFSAKGFKIGKSKIRTESKDYKLKDGERWGGKVVVNDKREVEEVIEPGLCNDYRQRDELNIIYFLDLEKDVPKWPWPFKKKEGFGIK